MVSDSARAGDPWPAPSRDLLNLPSQACRLHDKKPSAFSTPATCQSAFALSNKNFLRVRPCLSRACVASGAPRSAQRAPPAPRGLNPQGRVPLCPHPVCPPDVRLACASACFILFAHVLFFPRRLPACSSRARGFPFAQGWGFGGEGFAGGGRLCCRRVGGWPRVSCGYFLSVFAFGFDRLAPHEVSLYFCGFFCAAARPACDTSFSRMLN